MTIDSVAPSERSLIHFATPYLEVEAQSVSSLERTIVRELAEASHTAKRKKRKRGDEPSSMRTSPVAQTRFGDLGGGGQSVSM
jgi:hypothetical protein